MIKVSILESEQKDRVGEYLFYKNRITIGSDIGNDIYVPTAQIPNRLFTLECRDKNFTITPHQEVMNYHVNGKLTTSFKSLNVHDIFHYEKTKFKLIQFNYETIFSEQEILNNAIDQVIKENNDISKILTLLS